MSREMGRGRWPGGEGAGKGAGAPRCSLALRSLGLILGLFELQGADQGVGRVHSLGSQMTLCSLVWSRTGDKF